MGHKKTRRTHFILTVLWHLLDVSAVAGHGAVLLFFIFFLFFFLFIYFFFFVLVGKVLFIMVLGGLGYT